MAVHSRSDEDTEHRFQEVAAIVAFFRKIHPGPQTEKLIETQLLEGLRAAAEDFGIKL